MRPTPDHVRPAGLRRIVAQPGSAHRVVGAWMRARSPITSGSTGSRRWASPAAARTRWQRPRCCPTASSPSRLSPATRPTTQTDSTGRPAWASSNRAELDIMRRGTEVYFPYLQEQAVEMTGASPAEMREAIASLLSPVDSAALTERSPRTCTRRWSRRWRRGSRAGATSRWPSASRGGSTWPSIRAPVRIWHGGHDLFVPVEHGRWLATHIPTAEFDLRQNDGHVSLIESSTPRCTPGWPPGSRSGRLRVRRRHRLGDGVCLGDRGRRRGLGLRLRLRAVLDHRGARLVGASSCRRSVSPSNSPTSRQTSMPAPASSTAGSSSRRRPAAAPAAPAGRGGCGCCGGWL